MRSDAQACLGCNLQDRKISGLENDRSLQDRKIKKLEKAQPELKKVRHQQGTAAGQAVQATSATLHQANSEKALAKQSEAQAVTDTKAALGQAKKAESQIVNLQTIHSRLAAQESAQRAEITALQQQLYVASHPSLPEAVTLLLQYLAQGTSWVVDGIRGRLWSWHLKSSGWHLHLYVSTPTCSQHKKKCTWHKTDSVARASIRCTSMACYLP